MIDLSAHLYLALYRDITERNRMSSAELCELIRMLMEGGPGEPQPMRVVRNIASTKWCWHRVPLIPGDDLLTLAVPVPAPDLQVDLLRAVLEFHADTQTIVYASRRELSLDQHLMIVRCLTDWYAFWAVWHPQVHYRVKFERRHGEMIAEWERVQSMTAEKLSRRGMVLTEGRA